MIGQNKTKTYACFFAALFTGVGTSTTTILGGKAPFKKIEVPVLA